MAQLQKASPWPFVGIGGLVCLLFLYGASILFLPWWAVLLLVLIWLGLFTQATRWFTPRPVATAWLAAAGAVVWLAAVGLADLAAAR